MCHSEIDVFSVFRICCFISVLALSKRDFMRELERWQAEYAVLGKGWWNLECGENILAQGHWRKFGKKKRRRSQLINHWRNAFWKDSKCYLSTLGLLTLTKMRLEKKVDLAGYTTKDWWLWLKQFAGKRGCIDLWNTWTMYYI